MKSKQNFLPKILYYVTVTLLNGEKRTPNFFVWESVETAFKNANDQLVDGGLRYKILTARKMEFIKTVEITSDFYHEVEEESKIEWTPEFNQGMVEIGESNIPDAIVVLLSQSNGGKKSGLFLDEWFPTKNVNKAIDLMKKSDLPLFVDAKYAHFYHPTMEVHYTGWN